MSGSILYNLKRSKRLHTQEIQAEIIPHRRIVRNAITILEKVGGKRHRGICARKDESLCNIQSLPVAFICRALFPRFPGRGRDTKFA